MRCWRCDEEQAPVLSCARCAAVQEPKAELDHFTALGLPFHPHVDESAVAARYYEMSRRLHPDRFQTATPEEQAASVKATAALNAAFKTLRDVESRGRYWLARLGENLSDDDRRVPPDVAELVFDLQEKLAALRRVNGAGKNALRAELAVARREIEDRRRAGRRGVEEILERWPADASGQATADGHAAPLRVELRRALSELSYLRTLERDVRAGLDDGASEDGAERVS